MSSVRRKERLLEAAAMAQKRNGMVPESRAIDALWQRQLEEADRRDAEETPRSHADPRTTDEASRLIGENGGTLLSEEQVKALPRRRRGKKTEIAKHATRRLRTLKWFPEWHLKVQQAMDRGAVRASAVTVSIPFEGTYVSPLKFFIWDEVMRVLDESNAFFGHDWRRLREPRKSVSG